MKVLVSVIIPVYNSEKFLKRCVNSLRKQTLKEIEMIFINDGSTDNSLSILKSFEKIDNRIKIINQENSGPSIARNNGIKIAKGEYISFVDSDDWLDINMYKEMLELAHKSKADVVISDIIVINSNSKQYVNGLNIKGKELFKDDIEEYIIKELLKNSKYNSMWNKLYKKNIILENSIFLDEGLFYAEDWLFNIEFFTKINKAAYIKKAFYYYRRGHISLSNKYDENTFNDTGIWLYNKRKEYANKLNLYPYLGAYDLYKVIIHCIISEFNRDNISLTTKFKRVNYIINSMETREMIKKISKDKLTIKEKVLYYCILYKLNIIFFLYVIIGNLKELKL